MEAAAVTDEALLTQAASRLSRLQNDFEAHRASLLEAMSTRHAAPEWEPGVDLLKDAEAATKATLLQVGPAQIAPAT